METFYRKVKGKYVPVGAQTHLDLYPGLWLVRAVKHGSSIHALRVGEVPIIDAAQSAMIRMILEEVAKYINEYKLGTLKDTTFTSNIGYTVVYDIYQKIIDNIEREAESNQLAYDKYFVDNPRWTPDLNHLELARPLVDKIIKRVESEETEWHGLSLTNLYKLLDSIGSETYKYVGTPIYLYALHLLREYFRNYKIVKL